MGDDPKKPFVMPGEIISQAQREKLGLNRLRRWFENGTLEQADFKPVEAQRRLALQKRAPVAVLDSEEPKSYIRDESGKVEVFKPEQKGVILEEAGLDKVEELVEQDQKRLERNAKAKAKRAADKAAKIKREARNSKARERRAAAKVARVNAGE